MELAAIYFPSAVALGALHALEPGHAKTLTAAYLIGTRGTWRDAILLGLSVAVTHSFVVVGICTIAVLIGREAFTEEASWWLAVGSSVIVILLGVWLLLRRLRVLRRSRSAGPVRILEPVAMFPRRPLLAPAGARASGALRLPNPRPGAGAHGLSGHHGHTHPHHEHAHSHDHAELSDDEHARAHAALLPEYVGRGERPSCLQIVAFGAAGGLVPCPAAVTVMLLSLSVAKRGSGLFLVAGFSLGLALTLVGLGLLVVFGVSSLAGHDRFSWLSRLAPALSAGLVIVSGAVGLAVAVVGGH